MLGRLLPVATGIDVTAAAQQDAVARVERVLEMAVHTRKPQPHAAREGKRPLEADSRVVAEVVQPERESDHRLPPIRHDWTFLSQSP